MIDAVSAPHLSSIAIPPPKPAASLRASLSKSRPYAMFAPCSIFSAQFINRYQLLLLLIIIITKQWK